MPDHCRRSSWGHRWSAFRAARVWRKGFFPVSVPHCTSPSLNSAICQRNFGERKESPFRRGGTSNVHFNVGYQALEAPKCSTWEEKNANGMSVFCIPIRRFDMFVTLNAYILPNIFLYTFPTHCYTWPPVLFLAMNWTSWEENIYSNMRNSHLYIKLKLFCVKIC